MNTFTVTVAGRERFDGEAPYTYVVNGVDIFDAIGRVFRIFCVEQEQDIADIKLIGTESFEGAPAPDCGFGWNDMRKEKCERVPGHRRARMARDWRFEGIRCRYSWLHLG
ncbi:hypothetical protein [Nonomuraea zeae]|uniref:hypothetical protein n=1 Tax=Nonomuraea zeae TaxID=1642303 RepID=UPI00361F437A